MSHDRFHGRVRGAVRHCDWPDCPEPGEFRAPGQRELGHRTPGFDGPGDYRWFCLEHIRAFNAGYDYFAGMDADAILAAQHPVAGWEQESRAFRPTAGIDSPPRWADYADPLEAIARRARYRASEMRDRARATQEGDPQRARHFSPEERRALGILGLPPGANRHQLRQRYSQLVRRYHPDRNGGDRSTEARLQAVVEAYQLLRKATAFS